MARPRPGIGSELLPVVLIVLCLAGTWSLVVTVHHRGAAARAVRPAPTLAETPRAAATAAVVALPSPPDPPPAAPRPLTPPVDPTDQALARLVIAQTEQIVEAQLADRKAEALEAARQSAVTEKERAKRREALVLTQVNSLADQAKRLETEIDEVVLERDVLARERDAAKAALAKARARSSYAVLPHKGPNGTWRRPIIIECRNGEAILQPNGPSFSLLDLSMILSVRSAPLVAAVAHELVRSQAIATPDGAPVVPYIFFVVRPDGIKPYYNARAQLEPLGMSFGYELVDQNLEIDFPDLDSLDEWDSPISPRPGRLGTNPAQVSAPADRSWPAGPTRGGGGRASDDPSETFVWPARPGLAGNGSGGGTTGGSGNGGGGFGTGTAGAGPPGLPGLPRGGRTGAEAPEGGALARGPYPAARNGLGRGGSGVDPLPLGTPGLDPDNPYDNAGAAGSTPGSSRSGGPHALGLTSGSAGGWSENRASDGSNPAQPAGGGARLIPVSPGGMPGLEDPSGGGGAGRMPNATGSGGAGAPDPSLKPYSTGSAGGASGERSYGTQDLASLTPGGSRTPASSGAIPPGSVGGGNVQPGQGPYLVLPGSGPGDTQPAGQPPPGAGGAGRVGIVNPSTGTMPAQSGGGDVDPNAPSSSAGSRPQGLPPSSPSGGSGDPSSSNVPSQPFGGNGTPTQGVSPPLSQLAKLAGLTGDPGSAGQSSASTPPSSSGLGLPVPMAGQNGQPSSSGDASDSGQTSSAKDGMRVPRSRSDLKKPMQIDVPFEMVVACGPEGVVIHPGGYRLSAKALKGNDALLLRDLKTIVQTRRQVDPTIHPIPSVRFLVEPNGGETYRDARRQTMLSGMDWPVAIQVSDSDILDNLSPREPF